MTTRQEILDEIRSLEMSPYPEHLVNWGAKGNTAEAAAMNRVIEDRRRQLLAVRAKLREYDRQHRSRVRSA